MATIRYGPGRPGKSLGIESALVTLMYGLVYLFTFTADKGMLSFDTVLLIPINVLMPLFYPTPLPLIIFLTYFVFVTVFRYFERSPWQYFLIGAGSAFISAGSIKMLDIFFHSPLNAHSFFGEGTVGTVWWLMTTVIASSILIRALRLWKIAHSRKQHVVV